MNSIQKIRRFITDVWQPQHFPKDENQQQKVQTILAELASNGFIDSWVNIQGDYQNLRTYYDRHYNTLHSRVMKSIENIIEEIEQFPQFNLFEAFDQRKF